MNPENLDAQLKLGQISLLVNRTQEARDKAELVLEKQPDSIEGLSLFAGVQIQEQDLDAALKSLEKAVSIDPSRFDTQLSLAHLYSLRKDFTQAEEAYLRAISLSPTSRIPYTELSRLYGSQGLWEKAESQLKEMVDASESKHQDFLILAQFYESRESWAKAERTFLNAVDASPKEDVTALVHLGRYYARRRSYDKALESLEKAAEIRENDLDISATIAQVYFDSGKFEDAEAIVDGVLEKDKGHVNANYLKGQLHLRKRDFSNALERFDLVVRESPRNARGYYFKGLSLIGKGEANQARQNLLEAVELDPRMLEARLMLAEFYLREKNKDLSREQIDEASKLAPLDVRVLMLQGNLEVLEQDVQGAEAAFKQAIEVLPNYSPGYFRLGLLYSLTKREEDALKAFQKTLDLDPQDSNALAFMIRIYVQDNKFEEAFETCDRHKRKVIGNSAMLARIEYLEGNIFHAKGDTEKALQSFEKAVETDPNLLAPYVALAKTYGRLGRFDEAISQYELLLAKSPDYLAGYMALGTIYDQQGDAEKAETYYRKALEINEEFAPAANNLAWNLAEKGGNIDEALGYAQIAKERMPRSATVMDTLGWIYYLKGSYLNAIAELRDSVELDSDNPIFHFHLGLAYHKNNQLDEARESLESALKITPDFKGAEDARKILKEIAATKTAQ
jgi:tetratricopeptide (TPR) repeat protein